ncbi:MAG TPA: hypothetical protein VNS60_01000 [Solirubrobacterales bacterium]|nr:hypothetical protein [Solirubrobacterales bacterium]
MQTELAFPSVGRGDHQAAEDALVATLEHQMELLTESGGKGTGEGHIVIRHLIARVLSDLMVATHLARHGYLSQAYNAVRTAYETQDLIELMIVHRDEAARWVNTAQGHKDFAPSAVRKRIGKPSFDEMYGHYSELAHPRFAGSRLSTFGKRHLETGEVQILVQVGPTMLDEFPDFWFLIMAILPTISRVIQSSTGLIALGEVTEAKWDNAAQATAVDLKRLAEIVEGGLKGFGVDEVDGIAAHFDLVGRIINEANEQFPSAEPHSGPC